MKIFDLSHYHIYKYNFKQVAHLKLDSQFQKQARGNSMSIIQAILIVYFQHVGQLSIRLGWNSIGQTKIYVTMHLMGQKDEQ